MVQQDTLDRVFACLADPVRRGVLIRLGDGPASVGELTEPTGMTLTGMTKHLRVLEEAGLIVTEKVGRARLCRLAPAPLDEAMAWIAFYQRLWARRLDGLDVFLTLRGGARQQEAPPGSTPPQEPRQRATNPSDDGKGPGE
ncbi:ArsR/SmtB family transcription factor [Actinoplanes utahensis]|nr:metalloregulator ArsR/SmtB family transcription factor [Actinoplanes utahensis]GIF33929.1 transcriptional regulator [Actinoplanes utahensis]